MNDDLKKLRGEIDKLDHDILQIIAKRVEIVKKIGKLKKDNNISLIDEKRKNELLLMVSKKAETLALSGEFIKKLYSEIHDHAVKIQASISKDRG